MTAAIFDQTALTKGNSVIQTVSFRTIKGFPVHVRILQECDLHSRGYNDYSIKNHLIKATEGHYPINNLVINPVVAVNKNVSHTYHFIN